MKRAVLTVLLLSAGILSAAEELDPKHELFVSAPASLPDQFLIHAGNRALLDKQTSPASTIKIALAAVGLQEKVITLDSTYICSDRHDKPTPLKLKQALDLSSNEYFEKLGAEIGYERLHDYFKMWGYPPIVEKQEQPNYASIARGKTFSVSPKDQIFFLAQLALEQLDGISTETCKQLDEALKQDDLPGLFGKTGSDREGSWFIGYRRGQPPSVSVHVLRSDIPNSDGKRLKRILIDLNKGAFD